MRAPMRGGFFTRWALAAALGFVPLGGQAPPDEAAAQPGGEAPAADPATIEGRAAAFVRPHRPGLPRRGRRLAPLGRRRPPDWVAAARARMARSRAGLHAAARAAPDAETAGPTEEAAASAAPAKIPLAKPK